MLFIRFWRIRFAQYRQLPACILHVQFEQHVLLVIRRRFVSFLMARSFLVDTASFLFAGPGSSWFVVQGFSVPGLRLAGLCHTPEVHSNLPEFFQDGRAMQHGHYHPQSGSCMNSWSRRMFVA